MNLNIDQDLQKMISGEYLCGFQNIEFECPLESTMTNTTIPGLQGIQTGSFIIKNVQLNLTGDACRPAVPKTPHVIDETCRHKNGIGYCTYTYSDGTTKTVR